jgi:hypothetical protein
LQKRIAEFGAATAFTRTLPYVELDCLKTVGPYMEKNLNLVSVEVVTVEEAAEKLEKGEVKEFEEGWPAKASLEEAQPGSPAVQFCQYFSTSLVVSEIIMIDDVYLIFCFYREPVDVAGNLEGDIPCRLLSVTRAVPCSPEHHRAGVSKGF